MNTPETKILRRGNAKRARRLLLPLTLCLSMPLLITLNSGVAAAQSPTLSLELQRYFESFKKHHEEWAVGVRVNELSTGKLLYGLADQKEMTPASVLKLITTLAALRSLGGSYRFPTEVFIDQLPTNVGDPNERRVDFAVPASSVGNLYVRGYGDPSVESSTLFEMAQTVRALGVRQIKDLYVDDSLFVKPPRASGERPHQAALNALSVMSNCYGVFISPALAGNDAFVSLTPGAPFELSGRVRTTRGKTHSLGVKQTPSSTSIPAGGIQGPRELLREQDRVRVLSEGNIGAQSGPQAMFFTVPDPGAYFGALFRNALRQSGVEVSGVVRRGETPEQAQLLHTFTSRELGMLLSDMNHASSNFYAGQLLFALGQDSLGYFRYDLGLSRINELLRDLGFGEGSFEIRDGSGLDRGNRLTAEQLGAVLVEAGRDLSVAPDFIASLSRFGQSGTLKNRTVLERSYMQTLRGDELHDAERRAAAVWAKTGTLDRVSSLAGFAEGKNGEQLVFAMMLSGDASKDEFARVEEEFIRVLIGMPAAFSGNRSIPAAGKDEDGKDSGGESDEVRESSTTYTGKNNVILPGLSERQPSGGAIQSDGLSTGPKERGTGREGEGVDLRQRSPAGEQPLPLTPLDRGGAEDGSESGPSAEPLPDEITLGKGFPEAQKSDSSRLTSVPTSPAEGPGFRETDPSIGVRFGPADELADPASEPAKARDPMNGGASLESVRPQWRPKQGIEGASDRAR